MESERGRTAQSAPTGCFKCGRPGHWSRDCPDSNSSLNKQPPDSSSSLPRDPSLARPAAVPKKRAPRPKLTPDLLLSDDGLGFVLRYFPRSFKYRGRGNEVNDLGNLIRLYREWHTHLLPYYSFDQFVRKVEQVAATKRVKTCIKQLRERVSSGGDPTKLYEGPAEDTSGSNNQGGMNSELNNAHSKNTDADDAQDLLNEAYEKVAQGENGNTAGSAAAMSSGNESSDTRAENRARCHEDETMITEEQRVRMEANKLRALERVRAKSSTEVHITDEQRARMEANRLKALERAAARERMSQSAS